MKNIEPNLKGDGMRIGIVRARFNEDFGKKALVGCYDRLIALGVADRDITLATIPGSLEAPLVLQQFARSGQFDALIALGAVIRGQTYHFEIVSNEMAAGITRVQLDTGVPIANGILTVETDEQAEARAARKGADCADVAVEMANLLRAIPAKSS